MNDAFWNCKELTVVEYEYANPFDELSKLYPDLVDEGMT